MKRKIITIDEEKCDGCGLCVNACHEGAIELVNGKAVLAREDFCDGLGDCLPNCPKEAISFEEREAPAYNEEAVKAHMSKRGSGENSQMPAKEQPSRLMQWPCQIKLIPANALYYQGADLLIAADCTAYAYASFHEKFMKGKIAAIGCPKLDNIDYSEKLSAVLSGNDIKSVTLVRMEVPCCGGLYRALKDALSASGKDIPMKVVIISTKGEILSMS